MFQLPEILPHPDCILTTMTDELPYSHAAILQKTMPKKKMEIYQEMIESMQVGKTMSQ